MNQKMFPLTDGIGARILRKMNVSNLITLSRIAFVWPLIAIWHFGASWLAWSGIVVCGLTDFLDGQVARRLKQTSPLGAILDPVADKFYILSLLGYLYAIGAVPDWYWAVVIVRNVSQLTSIPVLGWWLKIPFKVKPVLFPKVATALCFAVVWLLLLRVLVGIGANGGFWLGLMGVSAAFEIQILVTFWRRFWGILSGKHDTFE